MKLNTYGIIKEYSGTHEGLVYYYNRKQKKIVTRKHVNCKHTEQHDKFTAINQNLKTIYTSDGYIQDLKTYSVCYNHGYKNRKKCPTNWRNIFTMIMWAMAKQYPEIDLSTLTRADIYEQDLPCKSVMRAIDSGLLPEVKGYARFTNEI